jgi:hypothetical protein
LVSTIDTLMYFFLIRCVYNNTDGLVDF